MKPDVSLLPLLPNRWETKRLIMTDAILDDVPRLHAIFTACAYVEPWDPTFKLVPESDLADLVNQSLASEGEAYPFKLQPIRTRAEGEMVGYFHVYHGMPGPDMVVISMFVLHPDYQHHKYGQEVVAGLAEVLRGLGYSAIRLRVYLKNWPALRFWTKAGFTTIIEYVGDPIHTPESQAALRLEKPLR